jgi:hypothetical protein
MMTGTMVTVFVSSNSSSFTRILFFLLIALYQGIQFHTAKERQKLPDIAFIARIKEYSSTAG